MVVAAAVSILGGLATVPVDHAFRGTFPLPRLHLGSYTLHPPEGAVVKGTWTATGGGTIEFNILDASDYPIYQTNSTRGSFFFPASAPPYAFTGLNAANLTVTVSVTGSYAAPIL